MNLYRQNAKPAADRWGVTRWRKWLVRNFKRRCKACTQFRVTFFGRECVACGRVTESEESRQ